MDKVQNGALSTTFPYAPTFCLLLSLSKGVETSHSRMLPSNEPEATNLPSGENDTLRTILSCPVHSLTLCPVEASSNPTRPIPAPKAIWALLYLAIVGTVIAFVLFYWLVQRLPVSRAQLIPFLSTILAVLLGAIVLGERLNWQTGLGSAIVLGGLAVALSTRRRRERFEDRCSGGSRETGQG